MLPRSANDSIGLKRVYARAQALLARGVPAEAPGAAPADVPVLAGREQALAWVRAE